MKVAIPNTKGVVEGPGEAERVSIFEISGSSVSLVEEYENPALRANAARGIHMIRSAMERGATHLIVAEMGRPGFEFIRRTGLKVYLAPQTRIEEALNALVGGKLQEIQSPTHEAHGHH